MRDREAVWNLRSEFTFNVKCFEESRISRIFDMYSLFRILSFTKNGWKFRKKCAFTFSLILSIKHLTRSSFMLKLGQQCFKRKSHFTGLQTETKRCRGVRECKWLTAQAKKKKQTTATTTQCQPKRTCVYMFCYT